MRQQVHHRSLILRIFGFTNVHIGVLWCAHMGRTDGSTHVLKSERRRRGSNPQIRLGMVAYKATGFNRCPTPPHETRRAPCIHGRNRTCETPDSYPALIGKETDRAINLCSCAPLSFRGIGAKAISAHRNVGFKRLRCG